MRVLLVLVVLLQGALGQRIDCSNDDCKETCKSKKGCFECNSVNTISAAGLTSACQWCHVSINTTINPVSDFDGQNAARANGTCLAAQEASSCQEPNFTLIQDRDKCKVIDPEKLNQTILIAVGLAVAAFFTIVIVIWYRKHKARATLVEFQEREIKRTTTSPMDLELANQNRRRSQGGRTPSIMSRDPQQHRDMVRSVEYKCMSEKGLRIRGQPSSDSERVGILPGGTIVLARHQRGNWVEVNHHGVTGWAMIKSPKGAELLKMIPREEDEFDKIVAQTVLAPGNTAATVVEEEEEQEEQEENADG
mmetsp:Transcript_42406/g.83230  ORF Transcript_42406/g.83230 Transcript_42406/m.83230 type:complete len:307 (-) Transcript_42406:430-1350(-)|eukprot:CAMPEP_0175097042 /NCGR_PEP_ID=MMETSP0086_2-20121207/5067_1 /TAXON_ID=136419 /ORGANISM="Unknown Unknown, Strain D1" /LENGTH=306 /DNA_ID=CAMNT_0016370509 /DNA_START=49 /DNA_END=969 /DNA_ORIENTATION=+